MLETIIHFILTVVKLYAYQHLCSKNPECIEEAWDEWVSELPEDAPKIPNLNNASGVIDGWTQCVWNTTCNQDTLALHPPRMVQAHSWTFMDFSKLVTSPSVSIFGAR